MVTVLIDEVVELSQDATNADAHIQGSGASVYKSYLQCAVGNANCWLSDIELLCLCACRRQSVVILKHVVGTGCFK